MDFQLSELTLYLTKIQMELNVFSVYFASILPVILVRVNIVRRRSPLRKHLQSIQPHLPQFILRQHTLYRSHDYLKY